MREIVPDIFTWSWFSEPHQYYFNGHLVRDPDGTICIDPVEPTEDDFDALVGQRLKDDLRAGHSSFGHGVLPQKPPLQ